MDWLAKDSFSFNRPWISIGVTPVKYLPWLAFGLEDAKYQLFYFASSIGPSKSTHQMTGSSRALFSQS